MSLASFPKLALGLSGFETGVLVMPQVADGEGTAEQWLATRIADTRKLLAVAAVIMAGLLNRVPRYLPRYGMSPTWAQATRPLVLLFAAVAFLVTWILAVTTAANIAERPEGIKIAGCFIAAILVTSVISRVIRAYELRAISISIDPAAARFMEGASTGGAVHITANEPDERDEEKYRRKRADAQAANQLPPNMVPLFLEVTVPDASEFAYRLEVTGEERHGYRILTVASPAVPNAIAAICLHLRDNFGVLPHVYFEWAEGSPLAQVPQLHPPRPRPGRPRHPRSPPPGRA